MTTKYTINVWAQILITWTICLFLSPTALAQEGAADHLPENAQAPWVNDAIKVLEFIEDNKLVLHENSYDDYEQLVLSAPSGEKLNRLYDILIDAAFNNSQNVIDIYMPVYVEEIEKSASTEHRDALRIFNASRKGLSSRAYVKAIKALENIAFDKNTHPFASVRALSIVGYLYGYSANPDQIVATLKKMEAIAHKTPDHIVIQMEINNLKGLLASYTNDPEEMVKSSAESLRLSYQNKSLIFGTVTSENLTHLVMENGDQGAIDRIDALNQRIAHMSGNDYSIFRAYMKCGEYAVKLDRNARALQCFEEAQQYIGEASKSHTPYYLYSAIANSRGGHVEKARNNLEIAKSLVNDGAKEETRKTLNLAISEVLHAEGLYAEAYNGLRSYLNTQAFSQKKELGDIAKSLREYSDEKAALLREKAEVLASKQILQNDVISRQRIVIFLSALLTVIMLGFIYIQRLSAAKLKAARQKIIKANQVSFQEARTDQLTRIGNRRAFYEYCIALSENPKIKKYSLAILDLDGFKLINDTFGHDVGDLIIQATASRLDKALDGKGRVFRLGGDEFAIIFLSPDDGALSQFRECITAALQEPVKTHSKVLKLKWSLGAVLVDGETLNPRDFLLQSDYALYQAKEQQGTSFHIFSDADLENMNGEAQLANEVVWNLETSTFIMFGQIIVSSANGQSQPFGVEALLRAQTRTGDIIPPETFIRHAVSAGKVSLLTKLSLLKSIEMIKTSGLNCPLLFNLSRHQITDVNFLRVVQETLEATGFPADRLIIELSERTLSQDLSLASKTLRAFKNQGIRIALDDFGSGNTGLATLLQFECSLIKTDRNFLMSAMEVPRTKYLMSNLIEVCQNLNLVCIIEGLETPAEVSFIQSLGGRVLQGYIFGRPEEVPKLRPYLPVVDVLLPDDGILPSKANDILVSDNVISTRGKNKKIA